MSALSTAAASAAKSSITKLLTTPSKVAHNFDWRKSSGGSLLSMSICQNRIDLAVAAHPSSATYDYESVQALPSIPLKYTKSSCNTKVLHPSVLEELQALVEDWKVCGFVVDWPVQKEGRCGAQCGRVLHTLDQLLRTSSESSNNNSTALLDDKKRPVCLWDAKHVVAHVDEWGRDPVYGRSTKKSLHIASKEQYADQKCVAADIWTDFCRTHWPTLYMKQQQQQRQRSSSSSSSKKIYASSSSLINKTGTQTPTTNAYTTTNLNWLDAYNNNATTTTTTKTATYSKASL